MNARVLLGLIVVLELVALVLPARGRPLFVTVPAYLPGTPSSDPSSGVLAASPAGERFLHEMTADDVARGVWGLRAAGKPVAVDEAQLAEAAALHRRLGELREARRALAARLEDDAVALAGWAYR